MVTEAKDISQGEPCGCVGLGYAVNFCPLHETALDMFTLAKEALSQLRFYNYEVRVTIGNHDKELIEALEAVVAKVEGQQ